MDFDEALAYMQSLRRFGIKLGNERFAALLERLGDPHRLYDVAHVAGTKGKGSTTAMIAAILREHGFRVGAYFSPYVYDVRERVQVDGQMISRGDFARLVSRVAPHVDDLNRTDHGQTTEFELKTAVGFSYFAEREVDFAAIEVGIGGRLDATNVVSPLVSVITNIGLDHTHILGDTHGKIAFEKAGIIKSGIPVVTATDDPEALEVIRRAAADRCAPLIHVIPGGDTMSAAAPASERIRWSPGVEGLSVATARREYRNLHLRLAGAYQQVNAACAIGAVEALAAARGFPVSEEAIRRGLAAAYVPARLEIVSRRPLVVLDGAHNELAARALAQEIRRMRHRHMLLVIGMVMGHEPDPVLAELGPLASSVFATQPTWIRGLPAESVARAAARYCDNVTSLSPPLAAARAALAQAGEEDMVLVTGSFYVVGDVRPSDLL